jgi:hypothetical protein
MKVINETDWRTADLKAILQRAAEQEFDDGARRKKLKVRVCYTRNGGCSGYAYYKSNYSVVRIARPDRLPTAPELTNLKLQFASVACHEFAHNRGMKHSGMPGYYKWSGQWQDYVRWAQEMELRPKLVKAPPSTDQKLAAKLEHVATMLKRAETRQRRAATLLKKWKRRHRQLELKAAAMGRLPSED